MQNDNQPILQIQSLVKQYPKKRAVNSISFDVQKGTCFGMLGPNGAGKTTTIEIIEGLSDPTSGTVIYKGASRNKSFREEIGIQFQNTALQEHQTCKEVLTMFSMMYHSTTPLDTLIQQCNLGDFVHRDVHKLSGGERQRLLLAAALVNDPTILFLDEPTTGLDPQARQNFWAIVRLLKKKGKTLILTTHYMEEAYALCDELIIMDHGSIIAKGNPMDLLDHHYSGATLKLPSHGIEIKTIPSELKPHKHNETIEMHVKNMNQALQSLLSVNIDLNRLTIQKPTLEDLFLHLTSVKEGAHV